jgi:hypothetical protein
MTARQWTLKEPAAIFFIRKLHNHGRYTMVVLVNIIQTRHLAAVLATNPIVASRRVCPVIESRSGRSHDQSEGGDSVCRPCAPGVHKLACATRLHKLGPQCPTLLKSQCLPWWARWLQLGTGKGRI